MSIQQFNPFRSIDANPIYRLWTKFFFTLETSYMGCITFYNVNVLIRNAKDHFLFQFLSFIFIQNFNQV